MHHKKRNGLMLIHRLAAAQGCLLSSDINIGEAPRRQIFYFFDLMVGGGWAYFFLCFSDCILLGIPPVCLRLKLLGVLWLPERLDSWKDWRCRGMCGCMMLPHRVSQFGVLFVSSAIVQVTREPNGVSVIMSNVCLSALRSNCVLAQHQLNFQY